MLIRRGVSLRTPTYPCSTLTSAIQQGIPPAETAKAGFHVQQLIMSSTIQFCGGAGTVTGSNFLLTLGDSHTRLLVDCGLTQGTKEVELLNWKPFSYTPKDISALIVTHAHIDHIGRIPKLVRDGFRGPIISTMPTKALAEPLLFDGMELLEHVAHKERREQLYNAQDISQALSQWRGTSFHTPEILEGEITLEFLRSGHILGSAMVHLSRKEKGIVFTGDIGSGKSALLDSPEDLPKTDYLVMESVYGDRIRKDDGNRREQLEKIVEDTARRGGVLLIPAFSTERTQDLLFDLRTLMLSGTVPSMSVYLDSPLAQKITAAYREYPKYFSPDITKRVQGGEDIFSFPQLHFVESMAESQKLIYTQKPVIIIAGSGMSSGGRVISHEEEILPDPASTLLVVGYQAAGSLGRRLIEGAKTVEIMGKIIPVHCRVEHIYGYSAHPDGEGLLEFVSKARDSLKEVFVVMGEPVSSSFLAQRIRDYLSVKAVTPEAGGSVSIEL